MKYTVTKDENDIVKFTFSDEISIDVNAYNVINHNIDLMLPCTRDLLDKSVLRYDMLGVLSLEEYLNEKNFDKISLYDFILKMTEVLEKIISKGINENKLMFDYSNIYISQYNSSIRYICLPIENDISENVSVFSEVLKKVVLSVKSQGAYELIGYVIEKTSASNFDLLGFKNEFQNIFAGHASNDVNAPDNNSVPVECLDPAYPIFSKAESQQPVKEASQPYSGREYIPDGVPLVLNASSGQSITANDGNKTKALFDGENNTSAVPYLSPVTDNSESAKIYLVGQRLTIGRSPENDLCINVSTVSGNHAAIIISSNGCAVVDLNSTNRTYVNGNAIEPNVPVKLNHQDVVSFNKQRYRYFDH